MGKNSHAITVLLFSSTGNWNTYPDAACILYRIEHCVRTVKTLKVPKDEIIESARKAYIYSFIALFSLFLMVMLHWLERERDSAQWWVEATFHIANPKHVAILQEFW